MTECERRRPAAEETIRKARAALANHPELPAEMRALYTRAMHKAEAVIGLQNAITRRLSFVDPKGTA